MDYRHGTLMYLKLYCVSVNLHACKISDALEENKFPIMEKAFPPLLTSKLCRVNLTISCSSFKGSFYKYVIGYNL